MRNPHSPQAASAPASQTSRSCRDEYTGRFEARRSCPWETIYSELLLEETSRDYRNEFIMTELLKLKPGSSCKDQQEATRPWGIAKQNVMYANPSFQISADLAHIWTGKSSIIRRFDTYSTVSATLVLFRNIFAVFHCWRIKSSVLDE